MSMHLTYNRQVIIEMLAERGKNKNTSDVCK